jgi:hypothetical protein
VNEHILAAIIAHDEAEALLRIEEFYDALAFADDLGRHSATTAAATAKATAATAAAKATASATAEAATIAEATAAATAEPVTAATEATASAAAESVATAAAEAAAIAVAAAFTTEKIVALVTAATAAVPLTPSIETHKSPNSLCPQTFQTNALGPKSATGHMRDCSRTVQFPTAKKRVSPVIPARLRGMGSRSAPMGVLWGHPNARRTKFRDD